MQLRVAVEVNISVIEFKSLPTWNWFNPL